VAGSVTQLLVEDTPQNKRAPMFALFSLSFALPTLLLPMFTGWMVDRWGIEPVMRGLFALTSVMTLGGCWWRSQRMVESKAVMPKAGVQDLFKELAATVELLLKKPVFWSVLAMVLLFNSQMNLNKAWSGLFITQSLKMNAGLVGQMATAGALAFVLVSLVWVPRLKPGANARMFFWVSILGVVPAVGLVWAGHAWALVALGFVGGVLGGLQGPLLSEHLADLLPPGREGLAQSLISCLMQVAVALSLILGGAIFETRFSSFPWILGGLSLGMGVIAWRLARTKL
jgi:Na+/melibiose symporter-like transporter